MSFCSRDFIASLRDAISFSFEYVSRLKDAKSGLERARTHWSITYNPAV